jgi:hypothetical protein
MTNMDVAPVWVMGIDGFFGMYARRAYLLPLVRQTISYNCNAVAVNYNVSGGIQGRF